MHTMMKQKQVQSMQQQQESQEKRSKQHRGWYSNRKKNRETIECGVMCSVASSSSVLHIIFLHFITWLDWIHNYLSAKISKPTILYTVPYHHPIPYNDRMPEIFFIPVWLYWGLTMACMSVYLPSILMRYGLLYFYHHVWCTAVSLSILKLVLHTKQQHFCCLHNIHLPAIHPSITLLHYIITIGMNITMFLIITTQHIITAQYR